MNPTCRRLLCYTLILSIAFPPSVFALPTGGQVVAGSVATTVNGAQMTLNQTSRAAVMNWQQFNIAPNEALRIRQSGADAAMLARVTGGNPSALLGRLQADGKLFLINPKGILVGAGAVIDTGSFLASTLDVADADFLKGGALTFKGDASAGIVNLGSITAREGNVLLFAHTVQNAGEIAAPNGAVGLGAGTEIFLASPDDTTFTVKLNLPGVIEKTGAEKTGVENTGTITAAQAELKAAGGSIYDLAVNQSGLIRATGVEQHPDGRVVLTADGGTASVTGNISAQKADGSGGEILVGGDYQGKNPAVVNATRTYVGPDARLDASATAPTGDGGKVVVWADGDTSFSWAIIARGGEQGGNGGMAEVSGKHALRFEGKSDLSAPAGETGVLLLDPTDITIVAGATATPSGLTSDFTWAFADDPGSQTLGATTLAGLLHDSAVALQATNSLTVGAAVSSNAANTLTLKSPTIAVNAGISLTNGTLQFQSTNPGVSLTSAGGATIAANQVNISGPYSTVSLAGAVNTPNLVFDQAGLTATSISATNAANSITQLQFVGTDNVLSGNVSVASSSAMTVSGQPTTNAGAITLTSGGNLTMQAGTILTASSNIKLASTGGAFINNAGTGLLAGAGRKLIYTTTTDSGFTDGGLGYTRVNSVSYPSDPQGAGNVIYIQAAAPLPSLTITANDFIRLYGQPDPVFTASYSGGAASDLTTLPSFSIQQGAHANVGNYTIVPSGAASSSYTLAYTNGTLTINPATLTVTANAANRLYGAANPAFSAQYSGFVNGDTAANITGLQWATSATAATSVGNYPIFPAAAAIAPNYAISYVPGILTVTPAPLTITAPNASRHYGDPNVFSGAVQYSGLVNGDTLESVYLPTSIVNLSPQVQLTSSATAASPVGVYAIIPSGFTLRSPNYTPVYVNGTLSVTRIPYTITGPDLTTLVGAVPANVAVNTPALPSFGPQFAVYATSAWMPTGNILNDASTPTYALLPFIVPVANTTLGDIYAHYDIQLVPGSIKTTRPPVDPVTLKQAPVTNVLDNSTIIITSNYQDTSNPNTVITLDNSKSTTTLMSDEELKAKMEVKESKVVVKYAVMDKYTLGTVVNEFGGDMLLPYVRGVLANVDGMKDMPEAQRKILEDYRDGKISTAELQAMMTRDPNALAAMMPALGKAMMDAIASGKPLSDAQQVFATHIAENVNKQRVILVNELQKQRIEFEIEKAKVGQNNAFALKTLPDIAMSAQQAAAEQLIGAAVGAGVGLGLGVGVAAVLNVGAVAGAIFPFTALAASGGTTASLAAAGTTSTAATGLGASSAVGIIGVAVGVIVVGVVAAVMVAQEQKNISAYDAAMNRAKTPVDTKLSGLDLKNDATAQTEYLSAFMATMLQMN